MNLAGRVKMLAIASLSVITLDAVTDKIIVSSIKAGLCFNRPTNGLFMSLVRTRLKFFCFIRLELNFLCV